MNLENKILRTQTRIDALDGIRGLAVLIVFMSHTSGRGMAITPWLNFHGIGHVGVYLFFVLSGFLLTKNLLNGQSTKAFFIRRFYRIVPLYYVVLIGVFVLQVMGYADPLYLRFSSGLLGTGLHFLFLQGDSVFWTIAAEFIFYLFLPAILLFARRFGIGALACAAAIYFCWYFSVLLGAPIVAPKVVGISHEGQFLDVFLCGVIAALTKKNIGHRAVALIFIGLMIVTLIGVSRSFLGFEREFYDIRFVSILYGVVFAMTIISVYEGSPWLAPMMTNRVLRFMGIVGFGWYLLHFAVLQYVNTLAITEGWVKFVISFGLTALVSSLAFITIEKPFIRIGHKLTSNPIKAGLK